ncbi:MAG TPA: MFS transporter [Stellaceae bacterium]|jgi:MFS family permease|nr:MFS transporter [Stellaceae bacterium]
MRSANTEIETDIPARLDRLPWSRFHTLVVIALGITWILDGLEVTLAGSIAGALQKSPVLHFSEVEVGLVSTAYLVGAVAGAFLFGYATDRFGRKKLFMVTLGLYLAATAATALSWDFASFAFFRVLTGAGIGGEYAAINSAIQELVPARFRGRTDLAINGSFWVGAALGALGAVMFLKPGVLPDDIGWRAAFGIGAVLGLAILLLRRWVPESPRWLMLHNRLPEAEAVIGEIEKRVEGHRLPPPKGKIRLSLSRNSMIDIVLAVVREYPRRAVLGLVLMGTQAFFYNAIFFSYALVLTRFFGVPSGSIGWYVLPFALGNFVGPLVLGPLFDTIGRKPMITFTYAISGILLAVVGYLFRENLVGAAALTACWTGIFFFASAAASAAYLTVSESFPLEARAMAIAFFYAVGTACGGAVAPYLFAALVGSGERGNVFLGYLFGAALMIGAAIVELLIGIKAERQSLEDVARPLSAR